MYRVHVPWECSPTAHHNHCQYGLPRGDAGLTVSVPIHRRDPSWDFLAQWQNYSLCKPGLASSILEDKEYLLMVYKTAFYALIRQYSHIMSVTQSCYQQYFTVSIFWWPVIRIPTPFYQIRKAFNLRQYPIPACYTAHETCSLVYDRTLDGVYT